jgi:hypothetical protein
MGDVGPLAAAALASGCTPKELAGASGIPEYRWRTLATCRPVHAGGRPWRPTAEIVDGIARGLNMPTAAVRGLIEASYAGSPTGAFGAPAHYLVSSQSVLADGERALRTRNLEDLRDWPARWAAARMRLIRVNRGNPRPYLDQLLVEGHDWLLTRQHGKRRRAPSVTGSGRRATHPD